jgi:hypothetical protein
LLFKPPNCCPPSLFFSEPFSDFFFVFGVYANMGSMAIVILISLSKEKNYSLACGEHAPNYLLIIAVCATSKLHLCDACERRRVLASSIELFVVEIEWDLRIESENAKCDLIFTSFSS